MNTQLFHEKNLNGYIFVALSAAAGWILTMMIWNAGFSSFLDHKRYYDFGPSLLGNSSPVYEMYFYILLTIMTFLASFVFSRFFKPKKHFFYGVSQQISEKLFPFFENKTFERILAFVLLAAFFTVLYYHIGKMPILLEQAERSGLPQATYIVLSFSFITVFLIAYASSKKSNILSKLIISMTFVSFYFVYLKEWPISWGIDTFHEGESFLTGKLFFAESYRFFQDIIPVHGFFRNVIPSYISILFTDNSLYFERMVGMYYFAFLSTLILLLVYRFTTLLTTVAFFLLTYTLHFYAVLDLSPFFLFVFLLYSLRKRYGRPIFFLMGLFLALESLYSYEFMIFVNIALFSFVILYALKSKFQNSLINLFLIGYFSTWAIFLMFFISELGILFEYIKSLLSKSPNLLERPFSFPQGFSSYSFMIYIFFPLFFLYHMRNTLKLFFLQDSLRRALYFIFSALSLLFFIRAFNRSDDGHILLAFYISFPIILISILQTKYALQNIFKTIVLILLILLYIPNALENKSVQPSFLKQNIFYDKRIETPNAVPRSNQVGNLSLPGHSYRNFIGKGELVILKKLIGKNVTFYDFSNQPLLVYGILGNPVITNDYHTLFYNTFKEQEDLIKTLESHPNTAIIFSSNHWSETLDGTYQEYRLPIVSQYLFKTYPYVYKIGRFTLLARNPLPLKHPFIVESTQSLRRSYDLRYAPMHMKEYKQEQIAKRYNICGHGCHYPQFEILEGTNALNFSTDMAKNTDITFTFSATNDEPFQIHVRVKKGQHESFVRLDNIPVYIRTAFNNLKITFSDPSSVKNMQLHGIFLTK